MKKRHLTLLIIIVFAAILTVIPVSATKTSTSPYYYQVAPNINYGATVFVGEQHLNLIFASTGDSVGYFAPGVDPFTEGATLRIIISNPSDFEVPSSVANAGPTSNWYILNPDTTSTGVLAFRAVDPALDVAIWDFSNQNDVTDVTKKPVPIGDKLGFKIATNMYQALDSQYRSPVSGTASGDGYIDIKVKMKSGPILTQLYTANDGSSWADITSINVAAQPYTWGDGETFYWATGATTSGRQIYTPGTYIVWAESQLNNMKENYRDASNAYYTGKTVSPLHTVKLAAVHGGKK